MQKNPKSNRSFDSGDELFEEGLIGSEDIAQINFIRKSYAVKAPYDYIKKIAFKNDSDPLWATVIPSSKELVTEQFELKDPIGDSAHSPLKGIVHRHRDRVLLMPTNICAMYCRFCFRRNMVGKSNQNLKPYELSAAMDYIRVHNEIWEVILTGGDPFILSNGKLQHIVNTLITIPHIKVIRFHTRIFIADPGRIDSGLVRVFKKAIKLGKAIYMISHINHLREINEEVEKACAKLINIGIPFLNQSVLLKGINDSYENIEPLLKKLVELRIKPYYLHQLDLTVGTDHFRVGIREGQELIRQLRSKVSGLCIPTYMLDIPGGYGKVPIEVSYLHVSDTGVNTIEDINGIRHEYPLSI